MILLRGPDMSMGTFRRSRDAMAVRATSRQVVYGPWPKLDGDATTTATALAENAAVFDVAAGQLAGTRPEQPTTKAERSG